MQRNAAHCTAPHCKAKQHGLVILRVISPGRFDPSATHCNEQNSSSTQSSELQSKSGRALETVPFLMCFHINCKKHGKAAQCTAPQGCASQSKSVWSFSEWPHRCVLGHIERIELQCRAVHRTATQGSAKQSISVRPPQGGTTDGFSLIRCKASQGTARQGMAEHRKATRLVHSTEWPRRDAFPTRQANVWRDINLNRNHHDHSIRKDCHYWHQLSAPK